MIARLGTPAHSSSIASRKLRALQEPQPPKPVIATEASEKLAFRLGIFQQLFTRLMASFVAVSIFATLASLIRMG